MMPAACGILMAFAARLGIVERAKTVAQLFHFFELGQIGSMGCLIHDTVRLAVERGGCFGMQRGKGEGYRRAGYKGQ
jgi:hypothetical protein